MRAQSAMTLVQAMAVANPPLDVATAQRARAVVVNALSDRSVEVRVATVTALAEFGDESMIPALLSVAKSDPVVSFRDYTAGAIARMRKRLRAVSQDIAAARR
jgi:HEAT repeat protein